MLAEATLQTFDVPGPRYTSYPTADHFVEAFGPEDYRLAVRQRRHDGAPISVYVHVPFCASLCYYCACNKIVTRHASRGREYLRYLGMELDLQVEALGSVQLVSQLHVGGGTPTFLDDEGLSELMRMLRSKFALMPAGEYSIEIDPRTVDAARLGHLSFLGFNRLSFGVQDFETEVQRAVHRIQPAREIFDLMASARALNFQSINIDLIHGLPCQTLQSFERTLEQVCSLRPDRVALYAYAHLPERFKAQRRIQTAKLPPAAERVAMMSRAIQKLGSAGYEYIGMDHFALADDALAVAKRQGRLHRNFQGYSTQPDTDLIALGVSAIGRVGGTYSQNAKTLAQYCDSLERGRLPIERGLVLTREDVLRRAVIMAIMCQGYLDYASIGIAHLVEFRDHFAVELAALGPLEHDGLVTLTDHDCTVTEKGWFAVRAIAMVFDRHLQHARSRNHLTRII
ncbi:coproporphyrinogen III oxidase, SAM and NAD(P)H dependent, oxygen-independent [Burkholderiales bacterium 8X]|nr:coproporphyrinogen III oxidase, SAM and NAD(P)H dependent, oxygen-independent [Burkholderiales bacterium 8X]